MSEASALLGDWKYKIVGQTTVGFYRVSTVWLGLDHNHSETGPPIIFETMVFNESAFSSENMAKGFDDPDREHLNEWDSQRYSTEDEAVTGHRQMVELIQASIITEEELLNGDRLGRAESPD